MDLIDLIVSNLSLLITSMFLLEQTNNVKISGANFNAAGILDFSALKGHAHSFQIRLSFLYQF